MISKLLSVFLIVSGGLLLLIFWAASVGFVYWDVYRRDLPWKQQMIWIAVVALLPLLGFFIYLFSRFVAPFLQKRSQLTPKVRKISRSEVKNRETMAMHVPNGQVYLPTIAVEAAGELSRNEVQNLPRSIPYPDQAGPAYIFSWMSGPGAGREFEVSSFPALIGRAPEAAIQLEEDRSVSRQHAEIYQRGGWLFIRDLESRHGTQVNGVWISDQRLESGDEILIGDSLLAFKTREPGNR